MTRPTLAEILGKVASTVRCQLHNTRDGRKLEALDAAAYASVETQLVGNLAQLIDGILTDATGIES